METKQHIGVDYKSTTHHNTIKRLIYFVQNLEEKLSSVKLVHNKLYELISVVSKTHETIVDELSNIKTILNEQMIEQEDDEMIPIDGTKSEWDDDDDDDDDEYQSGNLKKSIHRQISPLIRRTDRLLSNSALSNDSSLIIENNSSSSTRKRSSNLKKSDRSSLRAKSPKSVSFSFDKHLHNPRQPIKASSEQLSNEQNNENLDKLTRPSIAYSASNSLNQNQDGLISKNEKNRIMENICIHEIESRNGDYLRLLNISNSNDYDLGGYYLQQTIASKSLCRFRFPFNTIIRAGHTITIWCGPLRDITPQPPHVFLWKEQPRWEIDPQCITTLVKPNGQSVAWFRNSLHFNINQSSSDILHVHSKSSVASSDVSSNASSSIKRPNRVSKFSIFGNSKPPFAHSTNSSIHPDHNDTQSNNINDLRSHLNQKNGVSQLLNRPKSSPFASHNGCKQDLISRTFLQTQQLQQKQTTIKT